jgi:2-methylcitrate dehydratase PrpD
MKTLATYIAQASKKPMPKEVVERTKHHLLDTLAAMVSGSRLPPGRAAISYIRTLGGTRQSVVIGSRFVTTAEHAALANGMLAHADETDDSHAPSLTHPGCGVVPAALAMGERERSNGTQLLRAVALGYDVGSRLSLSLHAHDFREAGHSTHTFGPMFGAAAAAGALAKLNYDQCRHLLSYTVQQASGVSCWMRDEEHIEKAFDFGGMRHASAQRHCCRGHGVARLHRCGRCALWRAQFLSRLQRGAPHRQGAAAGKADRRTRQPL